MADENLGVNPPAEAPAAGQADVNQQPPAASSEQQATPPAQVEKQIDEYVKNMFKEDESESAPEAEQKEGEKDDQQLPKAEGEKAEEGQEDQPKPDEQKGPIPYERFAEVNTAKTELEQKVSQMEPLVQAQQSISEHCIRNNIQPQEFQFWMDVAALAKTNPQEALKKLAPQLEVLQGFTGEILPKDLQAAVDSQEISLPFAKRLAALENQLKFNQNQAKFSQEQLAMQQQQHYEQEVRNSVGSWIASKQKLDPDFKPKASVDAPDGKFEYVMNKFGAEGKTAKTLDELIKIAEKSYAGVEASLKAFAPRQNGHRVVKTTQSTTRAPVAPKSVEEVIASRAAKHGITFTPPKQ